MRAEQSQIDTIANNVANLNTTGFRRGLVSFSAVTAATDAINTDPLLRTAAATAAVRGAGTLATVGMSTSGGALQQTSSPMDVAIDGDGFLEVTRADGTPAYTRAGSLQINSDGVLAIADGTPLVGNIQIPPDATSVQIGSDGTVTAMVGSQAVPTEVGHIDLVTFNNPSGLQAVGSNLYVATEASGTARSGAPAQDGRGTLKQGYLESSNVQLVQELTSMMVAQRSFEMNGRVIQAADQMMAITNSLYRS
jgi:flagellar basal-body rod protein FlgG